MKTRLFNEKFVNSPAQKQEVILWMLTGEAENLKHDIHFDEKNYLKIETTTKERADKIRNQFTLYDHKDWNFLKSIKELQFEYENIYPNDTPLMINEKVNHFINTDPYIEVVKPSL